MHDAELYRVLYYLLKSLVMIIFWGTLYFVFKSWRYFIPLDHFKLISNRPWISIDLGFDFTFAVFTFPSSTIVFATIFTCAIVCVCVCVWWVEVGVPVSWWVGGCSLFLRSNVQYCSPLTWSRTIRVYSFPIYVEHLSLHPPLNFSCSKNR